MSPTKTVFKRQRCSLRLSNKAFQLSFISDLELYFQFYFFNNLRNFQIEQEPKQLIKSIVSFRLKLYI